ncbi:MAG: tyrosine-type recombinase/integrase [Nanoarchaeota archaeon]|nr:tyrosine-type recombinase/integrase [Nanoarchaeota archaeon]
MIKIDIVHLTEKEMLRRKYSPRTIQTYKDCLKKFLRFCDKPPRSFTKLDVKTYLNLLVEKGVSGSTLNVNLNALGFVIRNILNKNFMIKIKYSKTPKRLPIVLTQEEIIRLINSIENTKHKLMIKLMYSAGFRVSELVNLTIKDFEFENNYGWVRHGKGNKDRMFVIAASLKEELLNYINENKLSYNNYLFEGRIGAISVRSIQEILKKAAKTAKINKRVHAHALRHSFATHLIENGYDVASVQSLLGHNSVQTTMVYLHIAKMSMINVKSPLDDLKIENSSNINPNYEFGNNEERGLIRGR